jgi:hypothetical protein
MCPQGTNISADTITFRQFVQMHNSATAERSVGTATAGTVAGTPPLTSLSSLCARGLGAAIARDRLTVDMALIFEWGCVLRFLLFLIDEICRFVCRIRQASRQSNLLHPPQTSVNSAYPNALRKTLEYTAGCRGVSSACAPAHSRCFEVASSWLPRWKWSYSVPRRASGSSVSKPVQGDSLDFPRVGQCGVGMLIPIRELKNRVT